MLPDNLLRIAYIANIIILTPVLFSMFADGGQKSIRAFQGTVTNSDGLRLLVASLWFAILIMSIIGLWLPWQLMPLLGLQVIYKATYLFVYILPTIKNKGAKNIPWGVTMSFVLIILTYPFIIWANLDTFQ
ncbi:MAG: hypothetical protein IPP57_10860 [Candidatus Obscuribacter sp.]|jgi:hypothetical protein|nr:hypothetical protein [Candidatus Obscuribacter sp.]MDQ5968259.1 hypothetical protein [Cyanobacteriota bacterium erpe_2018_sw_39hr_WHONDRS-SW48-000098_B_bin.30]MBK9206662.1 hypothetical protein [Candidatus Obscuribacter sp.]MBK9620850.1 hypothetical protein [Candidatus Obscuribacter sp.]MBK9771308.1 hypothetical protein [Candidatus Obscuribacter sp.]